MNCNIILKNEKIFEKLLTKSKMIIIIISEQKFEKTYKEMETVIMITNLHIKNIGIIDDLEIDLNKGMNVLTGETGAGKTLIIDSISIISGGRF